MSHFTSIFGPDAKGIHLKPGTKFPDGAKHPHGYHDAVPLSELTGTHWGLVVDGLFIVVDIDAPEHVPESFNAKLPNTYRQLTKRGMHYVYKLPKTHSFDQLKNSKLIENGVVFGDIKVKGYIVGAGSTVDGYIYQHTLSPIETAPQWLMELAKKPKELSLAAKGEGRQGIPSGSHDEFLFKLASWARGQADLSEAAISTLLRKGPLNVLQDPDEKNPYDNTHIARIAHSAARYAPLNAIEQTSITTWRSLAEIETNKPTTAWWLYRFVPKGELVTLYGAGGIGKSSWASWLAAQVVSKGAKFGFAGIEEPFLRFGIRAHMSQPNLDVTKIIDISNGWLFPRDADKLREMLEQYPLDVVYFDSIYNHFEPIEGLNMAERTRACLSPLASIAQDLGVTIIGTFHENKAGDFLGSVEMVNVARVVLKSARTEGKPFKLTVKKTNFMEPGHGLNFEGAPQPGRALDGTPWLEVGPDGEIIPEMMFVMSEYHKSSGEDVVFNLDEIEESPEAILAEFVKRNPEMNNQDIAKALDWPYKKVRYWKQKLTII